MSGDGWIATIPAALLRPSRRPRRRTVLLAAPIAALSAVSLVGNLLAPTLVSTHPLLLVSLSPRTLYLAVAAGDAPLAAYLAVGLLRLCAADPCHFRLGALLGSRLDRAVARLPRACRRVGLPAVTLWPTGKVLMVAGAAGLPHRQVVMAAVTGTLARLVLIYSAGRALAGPLETLAGTAADLAPMVVPLMIGGAGLAAGRRGRLRRRAGAVP